MPTIEKNHFPLHWTYSARFTTRRTDSFAITVR